MAKAGIRTTAAVEVDEKARGVLAHRFPEITLFNDVQDVSADDILSTGFNPERGILTAGFPCQDVSVAGKRAGLAGARTGLFWHIIRIAADLQPRWFLLENVPGLLSSNRGRDMGTVLGALAELGYGVGWRVLDAQHFGVPQRRRRVFLAGCLGDIASAGEVLLEPESGEGDSDQGGATRPEVAGAVADGSVGGGGGGLLAGRGVVPALTASGVNTCGVDDNQAQAGHLVPQKVSTLLAAYRGVPSAEEAAGGQLIPVPQIANTLTTRYQKGVNTTVDDAALAVSYRKSRRAASTEDYETWVEGPHTNTLNTFDALNDSRATQLVVTPTGDVTHTLTANGFDASEDGTGRGWPTIGWEWGVRRLTPMECERLQGFPDEHTAERWDFKKGKVIAQSDSARGMQLGNAVAVPVVEWIAKRILAHDTGE